ncbi:MAG TPA: alpha/beta fold hydrolase [Actinophytocola sp.]|uniref:alpha/beta hydrolase n=1 Tax=Actinophytocola sp. TaxID=1872138 RepID=UPI002DDCCB88|nr:alpha/beta fold hydrolase [Actinophytocola sp.]HEV2782060.1 alpha/beta fold hydrolase [Actinophytocola sp.]
MTSAQPVRIGGNTALPARREPLTLSTSDGLRLVGELALPAGADPRATLVCLHPLPTHGGMMDSHLIRKAAFRLPALAGLAVLRFNTRGTVSEAGRSDGRFSEGRDERLDVAAALDLCRSRGLPEVWVVGWSFGSELALMYGLDPLVRGAVLISPPLRRARPEHLRAWGESGRPVVCLVPELDDFLRPPEARERFAAVPQAKVIDFPGAKHLFVGQADEVLDAVVAAVAPDLPTPLPRTWAGEYETRKVTIVDG